MLEIGKAKIILKIDTLCAIHYRIDHHLYLSYSCILPVLLDDI